MLDLKFESFVKGMFDLQILGKVNFYFCIYIIKFSLMVMLMIGFLRVMVLEIRYGIVC